MKTWIKPNFQFVDSAGVEHKQKQEQNTVRAIDDHVMVDDNLK